MFPQISLDIYWLDSVSRCWLLSQWMKTIEIWPKVIHLSAASTNRMLSSYTNQKPVTCFNVCCQIIYLFLIFLLFFFSAVTRPLSRSDVWQTSCVKMNLNLTTWRDFLIAQVWHHTCTLLTTEICVCAQHRNCYPSLAQSLEAVKNC